MIDCALSFFPSLFFIFEFSDHCFMWGDPFEFVLKTLLRCNDLFYSPPVYGVSLRPPCPLRLNSKRSWPVSKWTGDWFNIFDPFWWERVYHQVGAYALLIADRRVIQELYKKQIIIVPLNNAALSCMFLYNAHGDGQIDRQSAPFHTNGFFFS